MKFFNCLLFAFLAFFFFVSPTFADENFDIRADVSYEVLENNSARVTKNISILNKKEFTFSPNYNISFGFKSIKNIEVYNNSGSIPFDFEEKNGVVNLQINFVNPPKGTNSVNNFTVRFETDELVEKKGDIYEVDIPGISDPDSFLEYNTTIKVPQDYPGIGLIKPNLPEKKNNLTFSKEETKGAGIVLIFGQSQYYELNLNYNISNPNLFPIKTEVAFPPNTNYQKVQIESLTEEPLDVKIDSDGNWIAEYSLLPREKKTIKAKIRVMLYSSPQKTKLSDSQIESYTKSSDYWETYDPEIKKIASELKTPEKIYEYVVNNLEYNFERVSSGEQRLGAAETLRNPKNAVCLEYTDLFVALARSVRIPARSVEGYAYTKNSKLRPTSLSGDILHAWAEYYDFEKEAWIMVDPTWGSTTHGINYFENLDLDHIAFVIKGENSRYPIPAGGYKFEDDSKDIEVKFINEDEFKSRENFKIENTFSKFSFAGIPITSLITITNTGNSYIPSRTVTIKNNSTGEQKEYEIKNLASFGKETFNVSFDTSTLTNSTHNITIQVGNISQNANVRVSFIPDLNLILMGGGIFVASTLLSITAYKTWRVYLQRRKRKGDIRR